MALLEVRELEKTYGGLVANASVSFDVHAGEIVGLIGPNGAGKTTLFNCVTGHEPPTRGVVVFDGAKLNGKRPDQVCRLGLARTWQKARPLPQMTVLDNVMVGALLRTHSLSVARTIALEQLEIVGMAQRFQVLAGALPIGERKKLEVARLLATQPRLVLFDEILGGLNPAETAELIRLVFSLKARHITQLIIEHNMKAVMSVSDRVIVLNSGRKLTEGSPNEVVNNPEVIAAYLGEDDRA